MSGHRMFLGTFSESVAHQLQSLQRSAQHTTPQLDRLIRAYTDGLIQEGANLALLETALNHADSRELARLQRSFASICAQMSARLLPGDEPLPGMQRPWFQPQVRANALAIARRRRRKP